MARLLVVDDDDLLMDDGENNNVRDVMDFKEEEEKGVNHAVREKTSKERKETSTTSVSAMDNFTMMEKVQEKIQKNIFKILSSRSPTVVEVPDEKPHHKIQDLPLLR